MKYFARKIPRWVAAGGGEVQGFEACPQRFASPLPKGPKGEFDLHQQIG
jgi:hypothetical protein